MKPSQYHKGIEPTVSIKGKEIIFVSALPHKGTRQNQIDRINLLEGCELIEKVEHLLCFVFGPGRKLTTLRCVVKI